LPEANVRGIANIHESHVVGDHAAAFREIAAAEEPDRNVDARERLEYDLGADAGRVSERDRDRFHRTKYRRAW
jgi:hypothetical protein